MTVQVGITKRANIDNRGDFVSASISIPLPFSSSKYSNKSAAAFERVEAEKNLENYKNMSHSMKRQIISSISRLEGELKILENKSLKFAENSRKVSSKSYRLGKTSYIELLQSELKLQKLRVKKSKLIEKLLSSRLEIKYLNGESLHLSLIHI